MKHIDKTPYRSETGEIGIVDRVQGMLKYGMSWYDRVKAQDTIAELLGKQLGGPFVLLQNVILPDTDIDLPLILIGPPGVFLINALHEKGVYVARDDEWGTLSGETFAPARINQVRRTQTMGRVLQVYLERLGHKGINVETIMMSADPALHIDSNRPAVRVVMSDALGRFALTLAQARGSLGLDAVADLEQVILTGESKKMVLATPAQPAATTAFFPETPAQAATGAFAGGDLDFSFADEPAAPEAQSAGPAFADHTEADTPAGQPQRAATKKKPKRKKIMGLTPRQLIILGVVLLCWLCSMVLFGGYYLYSIGWLQFA
jgi:hypothetical protein